MKSPPTQRRAAQAADSPVRTQLLEAAAACLRDLGAAGTTSREITRRAGANLAAITYYFGSKEALLAEALFDELRTRLEPAIDLLQDGPDPTAAMLRAAGALIEGFDANRSAIALHLEAVADAARGGASAEPARNLLAEVRRLLGEHIRSLQVAGLIPPAIRPLPMAALLVAVAYGIAVQVGVDDDAPSPASVASELATLLVGIQHGSS
jgi:AcrR family transcriptional regulator